MRSTMFTLALLIALAIVTLWWQLAEKRARAAYARAAPADSSSRARLESMSDSLRTLRAELERCEARAKNGP